jgi:hypothetical protein
MTRYHFNIRDRQGLVLDEEGSSYRILSEALTEAKASARDLVKQLLDNRTVLLEQCIEVTDDSGRLLAALPVVEVLRHPNFPRFQSECQDLNPEPSKPTILH